MGGGLGSVKALGTAFVAMVNPLNLATIGLIAGGAALVQWGIKAATAGRETRNLETAVEDAQDNLSNFSAAVDDASASLDTLEERFGTGAQAIRPFLQAVADLQQAITQTDVDAFGQALTRQFTGSGIGSMFRTLEGSLNQVFNLESLRQASGLMDDFGTGGAALEVLPARVQSLRSEFFGLIDAFEAAKGNLQEQDTILESMYFNVLALAEADEKRSKSENEILTAISQARLVTAETLGQKQQIAETTETASRAEQRSLDWATQTLARLQAQSTASQTVAEFGASSAQVMQQQAQAAQTALAAEAERRGVTGELAQSLQAALVSQQQAAAAAEQRVQADQRSLQLAREQEQAAQREAQLAQQRAHAEAAISQRLRNRVEVARAIVVHGKDSVEAKLAEEAVSRRPVRT